MPPMASPTRRVLGDKDVNASLGVPSPRKGVNTNISSPSIASVQKQSRLLSGAISTMSTSPRIGQKRRITEVEGVEARDWDEVVRASQATDVVSDSASETDPMETSMLSARSAADTTMTSFGIGASQEHVMDQEFEIPEPEMSQRTLEKIHAVTLPQNTSQPSQLHDRPELVKDASLDSVGMSAYLNFHSDGSSQGSDGLRLIDPSLDHEKQTETVQNNQMSQVDLSDEEKRKVMMEEKASQLRTRLQLAFFKVETRQTNTPFARLRIPESHRRKSQSPPSLPPPPGLSSHRSQSYSISLPAYNQNDAEIENRVAAMRAQATMQHKPGVRSLDSLPMPQIRPTAYSARWAEEGPSTSADAHGHPPQTDGSNDQARESLTSPPISYHSLHIHEDETATLPRSRVNLSAEDEHLPTLPIPKTPATRSQTNDQLSSPPLSQDEDNVVDSDVDARPRSRSTDMNKPRERRLTSSVVKGEAASGLLQLMRGAVNVENVRGPMCGL